MNRNTHTMLSMALAGILMLTGLTACGGTGSADGTVENAGTGTSASDMEYADMFTDRDSRTNWSATGATKVLLNGDSVDISGDGAGVDGSSVIISEAGTYYLSGSLTDGQIVVEAADDDKVQLVLDNVDITCSFSACILVKSANKVFVTLAEGSENVLSDTGSEYVQDDDTMTVDAVVFSKSDIVFNGEGSLTVSAGYQDGIVSKDDLKFTGGTYAVTAAGKGIVGRDSLRIRDGAFTVESQDDALHTSNDEKTGKGYLYIEGGTFSLSTDDDAVHAATALIIEDGTFDIVKCCEGLEGDTIDIDGGDISLTASDDGLNAAMPSTASDHGFDQGPRQNGEGGMMLDAQSGCYIHITGGTLYVSAEGDGIDSNGTIVIDGGIITVDGPTNDGNGALDCGTEAVINGGSIIAAGSSGMAETFSENSTQYSILYNFSSGISAGTQIQLFDEAGNTICSFIPSKSFSSVVISTPDIREGTYTIMAGNESAELEVSSISTIAGTSGGMQGRDMQGGNMHGGGMQGGGMQGGDRQGGGTRGTGTRGDQDSAEQPGDNGN